MKYRNYQKVIHISSGKITIILNLIHRFLSLQVFPQGEQHGELDTNRGDYLWNLLKMIEVL
jgi:hypothetical protein